MRNLKKFLALVLAMMMAFSLVLTASAKNVDGTFNDQSQIVPQFVEAVEVMNGMGVLKGDADPVTGNPTGNFRPGDTITRAEVAALVYRMATGDTSSDAGIFAQYGNFSDVRDDAWYAGYVGYCANAGYIVGYEGQTGPFGPTDNVTGYQALKMILMAMGYGVNGEFEGPSWQLHVSQVGNEIGVLKNINSTSYGNATLQQPARRDVVAEIFFQAAQKDTVVYTPAYGYQTGNMTNAEVGTSSLGKTWFGLTYTYRVVVGNQATGESATVMGPLGTTNGTDNATATVKYNDGADQEATYTMYDYPGDILAHNVNSVTTAGAKATDNLGHTNAVVPAGLNLKMESGLDLFGHLIKVWYDADSSNSGKTVYAYYDDYTTSALVRASGNLVSDFAPTPADDDVGKLGTVASGKGFSVSATTMVYTSDRYGKINTRDVNGNANGIGQASAAATTEPDHFPWDDHNVPADEPTNESNLYMLISNSSNKNLDLVITLEAELAKTTMQDTTAGEHTLTLGDPTDYFGPYNSTYYVDSLLGPNNDGVLLQDNLTSTSQKALDKLVTAWTVKGTNYTYDCRDDSTVYPEHMDGYIYDLREVTKTKVGVVASYNATTGQVTLDDGTSLSFTALPIVDRAVTAPGDNGYDTAFYAGVQYTFLLDELGQYVKATRTQGYEFLYGTYMDYETGALGTGDIKYAVTGVNWDGEKVLIKDVVSLDDVAINGTDYEKLAIAKKNLGGATGTGIGNEIKEGLYTGYAYNPTTKDLATDPASPAATDPYNGTEHNPATYWDYQMSVDYANTQWSIDTIDLANGWADVEGTGELLITPNTKFIVVEGTGTSTLNPVVYNGMAAFLNGAQSVTIDTDIGGDGFTLGDDYNVYFQVSDDLYNNVSSLQFSSDANWMIDTVIMPKDAVTWIGTNSLYFSMASAPSSTLLAGTELSDGIRQYTLYSNGESGTYWVDTTINGVEPLQTASNEGNFYTLAQVRTINGVPIYRAEAVPVAPSGPLYGNRNGDVTTYGDANCRAEASLTYTYTATNNTYTALIGGDVYNVSNAKVVNLSGVKDANGNALKLSSVTELNNAISVGYSITNVAIVNSGRSVSVIYVTDVSLPS